MGTRRDVASRRSAPSGHVATTTLQRGPFSRCQKVPFLLAISTLRLIEPGKPNQNAHIEVFNSRFRDECLTEHWFTSLAHVQAVIEASRREYNDARPKKGLGWLTPVHDAEKLAAEQSTVTLGL